LQQLAPWVCWTAFHTVFHCVPLHTSPVGESMGYRAGMLPDTEYCADRIVRLPLYAGLRDDEADRITQSGRRFFSR
jgi:dTDP-4-amino-4,6-dideoxygalactose transaminase